MLPDPSLDSVDFLAFCYRLTLMLGESCGGKAVGEFGKNRVASI